jgi:hypothetical protein
MAPSELGKDRVVVSAKQLRPKHRTQVFSDVAALLTLYRLLDVACTLKPNVNKIEVPKHAKLALPKLPKVSYFTPNLLRIFMIFRPQSF